MVAPVICQTESRTGIDILKKIWPSSALVAKGFEVKVLIKDCIGFVRSDIKYLAL
jgi:hypothetical protein